MSQNYTNTDNTAARKRRTTRAQRNRPTLVTANTEEQNEVTSQETAVAVEEPLQSLPTVPAPLPGASRPRKLPNFFPTVGKSNKDAIATDVVQTGTRPARRGKTAIPTVPAPAPVTKATTPVANAKSARPSTSKTNTRPASPFKTRYWIGIGLYLLFANFIGAFEMQTLRAYHMDRLLTSFTIFGGQLQIYISTLVFLATLIIVLVLLARFDLIPRSLSAMGGTPRRVTPTQNTTTPGERVLPPTMRQGVKGDDDQLYQEYRTKQRREKKR